MQLSRYSLTRRLEGNQQRSALFAENLVTLSEFEPRTVQTVPKFRSPSLTRYLKNETKITDLISVAVVID
jgi:hypothetical protein